MARSPLTTAHNACVIRRALRPRRLWKLQWPLKAPQVAEVSGLMDDVCAIATPRALAAAMPMMARRLQRDGARLEQSKSVWTTLSPATRAQIPTGMRVGQAEDAHGHLLPLPLDAHGNEMKTLGGAYGSDFDGVPIGNPTYVQARLASKLGDARSCIRAIDAALAAPGNGGARHRQVAWTLHRACVSGKFGHLLRCVYPTHLAHAAAQFDREYLLALLRVADAEWVFDGEHGGGDIVRARIALPVAAGGWGARSTAVLSPAAFIAGACAAVPAFADRAGVGERPDIAGHFPCLERIVGVGSFTERGGGFSTLVRGGAAAHSRLGRELAHAAE